MTKRVCYVLRYVKKTVTYVYVMYYGMLKKSFFRVDLWPLKGPFCFLRLESEDILLVGRVLEDYTQLLFVGVGVIFSLSLLLLLLAPKTRYISGANDGRIFLCRVLLLAPQAGGCFSARVLLLTPKTCEFTDGSRKEKSLKMC